MQAGKYSRRTGMDIEELISEGIIGAMEAVESFDLSYQYNFVTYAACWIKKSFRDYKYLTRPLRMPKNISMIMDRYSKDLYNGCDVSHYPPAVKKAYHENEILYLDAPANTPNGKYHEIFALKDVIPHNDGIEHIEKIIDDHDSSNLIKSLCKKFTPKKRQIIAMRFGLKPYERSHTLEEIAQKYGVTREAIRLILIRCFDKIKRQMEERGVLTHAF